MGRCKGYGISSSVSYKEMNSLCLRGWRSLCRNLGWNKGSFYAEFLVQPLLTVKHEKN
ncbi:MAG: hypothetical protein JWP88_1461 [Flaviaesturariibacter sp.]|nr:hypothetical protein [Flaviaesturariibacter sp.]